MAGKSKEEYPEIPENHIVRLDIKPYNPAFTNPRHFFSDWSTELIVKEITTYLNRYEIEFKISAKTWKLTYDIQKSLSDAKTNKITEQVTVQVEILSMGNDQVCV